MSMFQPGALLNKRYKVLRQIGEGGFGLIFEVRDVRQRNLKNAFGLWSARSVKILKVLNAPPQQKQDAEFLFRREASLLKRLDHPQVVKYVDDFDHIEDLRTLPCLVLEKVPGQTLEEWLKQHGPVPEEVALDWLGQCAEILDYLHNQQRVMHLDINPRNIIITPAGQLTLIDFGAARDFTVTLLPKLADPDRKDSNSVATPCYAPTEQVKGRSVPQSDYYALGRTLIYALTGEIPDQFPEDDEGFLIWQEYAKNISQEFCVLIDQLTDYNFQCRPQKPEDLKAKVANIRQKLGIKDNLKYWKHLKKPVLIISYTTAITSLALGLRTLGVLQLPELVLYDTMLRFRPVEEPDPRILVIEVTEGDLEYQKNNYSDANLPQWMGSLSTQALNDILKRLSLYEPSAVGVDILVENTHSESFEYQFVSACSIEKENTTDIGHFQNGKSSHFGFSNTPKDIDYYVRRQYIYRVPGQKCNTNTSFSYLVAKLYLENMEEGSIYSNEFEERLVNLDSKYIIHPGNSIYPKGEIFDQQTLINFRAVENFRDVATRVTLQEFLERDNLLSESFRPEIVLIGTTAPSFQDYHLTPYGEQAGVIINTHMVSQFISHVLDDRHLIQVTYLPENYVWTWTWMFSMSVLGYRKRVKGILALALFLSVLNLTACFYLFLCGYLISSISVLLAISLSVPVIFYNSVLNKL
jgi:CHASE2 domain-containing sensor protein